MPYRINNKCDNCGKCVYACTEDAIRKSWPHYEIDEDFCDDCGCCESACPRDGIELGSIF